MSKQMRDDFEAWAARHWLLCANKPVKMLDGQYRSNELQACWESWQASREAVVIELPQQSGANHDWNRAIRYCLQAIAAANLKVSRSADAEQVSQEVLEGRESFFGADDRLHALVREEIAYAQREIVRMVARSAVRWAVKSARSEPFLAKKWRGRP